MSGSLLFPSGVGTDDDDVDRGSLVEGRGGGQGAGRDQRTERVAPLRVRDVTLRAEGLLFNPERLARTGQLEILDARALRIERLRRRPE